MILDELRPRFEKSVGNVLKQSVAPNTIEMSRRLPTLHELEFKFELGAWGVTSMHPALTRGGASPGLVSIGPHGACAPTYP